MKSSFVFWLSRTGFSRWYFTRYVAFLVTQTQFLFLKRWKLFSLFNVCLSVDYKGGWTPWENVEYRRWQSRFKVKILRSIHVYNKCNWQPADFHLRWLLNCENCALFMQNCLFKTDELPKSLVFRCRGMPILCLKTWQWDSKDCHITGCLTFKLSPAPLNTQPAFPLLCSQCVWCNSQMSLRILHGLGCEMNAST